MSGRLAWLLLLMLVFFCSPAGAQDSLNMAQLSNVPGPLEDIWGYTDSSGREYALCCANSSLRIYEITNVLDPRLVTEIAAEGNDLKDVKTWGHYAYAANQSGPLQIIDLQWLPDSAKTVALYDSPTYNGAHNVIVEQGYVFATKNGVSPKDLRILDLANPEAPVEVGHFEHPDAGTIFADAHDVYVRDTFCYIANLFAGWVVVSIADITQPRLLAKVTYPGAVSHNMWGDTSGNYLFTTDETSGGHLRVWDVSDLTNISEVGEYIAAPDRIVHNCYVRDDLVYMSYYGEGVKIADISDPTVPVEVGWYDTAPGVGGGFGGCWGIYPYFPSGVVIASDLSTGLSVLSFNGAGAGFVTGTVTDFAGATPLADVEVTTLELGTTSSTSAPGEFTVGALPGTYTLVFSKFGWTSDTQLVVLAENTTDTLDVVLFGQAGGFLGGDAQIGICSELLSGVRVGVATPGGPSGSTDAQGEFSLGFLPAGIYAVSAGLFGYESTDTTVTVPSGLDVTVGFRLQVAAADDGETDQGWSLGVAGDDATDGQWLRADPVGSYSGAVAVQPENDHSGSGTMAFVTGNGPPGAGIGTADVDGGTTTLRSPLFSLRSFIDPVLEYWRWFVNSYGSQPFQDEFTVEVSSDNGASWVTLENTSTPFNLWTERTFRLSDYVSATDSMRIQFKVADLGAETTVEAAVDDITIQESGTYGDFNADGTLTSADIIESVNFVFKSGSAPVPLARADGDGNCTITAADIVFWVNRVFKGGPMSPVPCQCAP